MGKACLRRMRKLISREESESGQALVELAITAPLLVLMLLGMVEFAMITYTAIEVSNSARAAAQYGAMNGGAATDTTGMLNAAQADSYDLPTASKVAFSSGYPQYGCVCANGVGTSTCTPGDCPGTGIVETLTVQLEMTYTPVIHWPGLPSSIKLTGYSQQQVLGL
jgi:hypothetical protein